MKIRSKFLFAGMMASAALAAHVAFAQASSPAPAKPAAAGSATTTRPPIDASNYFRPRDRELIYVTLPGSLETPAYHNGTGIVVLDAANDYLFVKRIPTWDYPASMSPEQVSGVAASAMTNMIYVAARGRLGAWDLATDKKVWDTELDGHCCERPQVTPDGKYIVVGSDLKDYWYVVDPRTGKMLHKLDAPLSPGAHNLNLSADGKTAFMSPNNPVMTISDVATGKLIRNITFQDHIRVFVINKDATRIYTNLNNLNGFEIADVATGKILAHVENSGDWKSKWNATPRPRIPHGCPSHGIALVNDEKEVWVADGVNNLIHIFDNTKPVPVEVGTIKPSHGVYWITIGLDGKYAYVSSGDIIDTKTHKIVGTMKDEFGKTMYSEKLLDMSFRDGKLQRVANQFGNGFGDQDATGKTRMSQAN